LNRECFIVRLLQATDSTQISRNFRGSGQDLDLSTGSVFFHAAMSVSDLIYVKSLADLYWQLPGRDQQCQYIEWGQQEILRLAA
jgi:hypothetical protein